MNVPEVGSICCGNSNVIPIDSRRRLLAVPQPPTLIPQDAVGYAVIGDSLVNPDNPLASYMDGDVLICKLNITKEEIKPHTICLCYVVSLGVLKARLVRHEQGNLILSALNPEYRAEHFSENDVQVLGIVVGFYRSTI